MNDINLYEKMPVEENNFPLRLSEKHNERGIYLHWHEHLEILYFIKGNCKLVCDGVTYPIKDGNIFVFNSSELHFAEKSKNTLFKCMIINPDFYSSVSFSNVRFENFIAEDNFIKNCFDEIFEENETRTEGYDLAMKASAYKLITHLLRNHKVETLTDHDVKQQKNKIQRIDAILYYISLHYDNKLTTAKLSKAFHLNEHYFCHFFKETTGQTPVSYINRYRVERAATLLKITDISVTDIAMKVGFDDPNYFTRTFKKYLGITPRKYAAEVYSVNKQKAGSKEETSPGE